MLEDEIQPFVLTINESNDDDSDDDAEDDDHIDRATTLQPHRVAGGLKKLDLWLGFLRHIHFEGLFYVRPSEVR